MKPAPETPPASTRRNWLFAFGALLNAAAAAVLAVPVLGYLFSTAIERRNYQAWTRLGPVSQFPEGKTRLATYRNPFRRPWDAQTADVPCWVRNRGGNRFQVFAINCAHLGCPVRWFEQSGLFLCPCHGGAYYEDGSRAAGPPPRGLFEYQYKIENGFLMVKGGELPTLANPV